MLLEKLPRTNIVVNKGEHRGANLVWYHASAYTSKKQCEVHRFAHEKVGVKSCLLRDTLGVLCSFACKPAAGCMFEFANEIGVLQSLGF